MKKLLTILLVLVYSIGFGQQYIYDNTVKITSGKITIDTLEVTTDYLISEMPHCYFYKVDTSGYALTLDQNVWKNTI